MTTEANARSQPFADRSVMLVIPALLAAALALLPLLPRESAASVMTQFTVVLLLVLGAIDVFTLKVPNLLVYPSILFILAGTAVVDAGLLDDAVLGGAALLGIMFVLALLGRGTMGMGDVKFACLTGCALGVRVGVLGLLSGFVIGGVVAIVLLLSRLRNRKDILPLTPFLAAGALLWIVLAGTLVN